MRQAYHDKEKLRPDEFSPEDLMRRIRKRESEPLAPRISGLFASTLRRLAPVICLLILLIALMVRIFPPFDFNSENGVFQSFTEEREELTLAELFGA